MKVVLAVEAARSPASLASFLGAGQRDAMMATLTAEAIRSPGLSATWPRSTSLRITTRP